MSSRRRTHPGHEGASVVDIHLEFGFQIVVTIVIAVAALAAGLRFALSAIRRERGRRRDQDAS